MSFKESDDSNYDEDEEMTTIYIFRHGQADEENNHVIDYGYAVKNIKRLINGQYPRKIVSVDHPLDNGSRRFRETYEPLLSDEESVQLVERIFPDFFTDDFSQLESGTKFIFIGTLWNDIYPVLYHLGLSGFIELDDGTTDEENRLSMGLSRSGKRDKKVEAWSRWAYGNGLELQIPTSVLKANIFKSMLENDNSRSVNTTEMILTYIKELCDGERCDLRVLPFIKEESDIDAIFLTMENISKKYSGDRQTKAIEILEILKKLVNPEFSGQKNILKYIIIRLTNEIAENDWNEQGDDTDWNSIFGT